MKLKHASIVSADYGLNISADEYVADGIPIIRTSDFDDSGKLDLKHAKNVLKEFAVDKLLLPGDVLFSRAGTIGRFLIFEEGIDATYAAYLVRFRLNEKKLRVCFLRYWAQSDHFWKQVRPEIIESTIGNFNATKIANLYIPDIDISKQASIAKFLDYEICQIDKLIEKRQRFADLVYEARQSLYASALSGELLQLKCCMPAGWAGAIPEHWRIERAKVHFVEREGRSKTGKEELLTVSHITGVTKRSEKNVNMFLAESNEGYKLVEPSDVVINTMWAWMGAMGVSRDHGLISPAYGIYRPIKSDLLPEFVDLMLRSRPFIAEATRRSKGIHSSRLRLYPDAFLDTPLPIPPISEQEEILSLVSERTQKEDQLLELNSKAITLLEEKRAALITAAVKGELNIGDDSVMPALANDNIPLLVASEIIRANQRTSRFGRVKFQKLLYLAETHIGFTEINGSYDREAAGPLDRALLNRLEIGLEAQNLFRATNPDGRAIIYEALGASPAGRDELRQAIGSRSDALFTMIQKLSDMKTKSVEAIATLFAVWNDALIDAQSPDDDFIINGVLNDWHPEKRKKFRAEDLRNWLGWMRRNGFVPKGQGPRTSTGRLFV